jgi:hypothetical protein
MPTRSLECYKFWDYTVLVEITQVECCRLHSFSLRQIIKGFEITQFWWRLHRLNVGDYTVFSLWEIP